MPPRRRTPFLAACAAGCAMLACDFGTAPVQGICTDEARASLVVWTVDAVTGTPVSGGVTLMLRDGAFLDSVTSPLQAETNQITTDRAFERPGTYAVRVRRAGYADWTRENVRVTADECHVITVVLEARLQAIP